ncbi:MAG: hypothetical protein MUF07_09530 [Steroidobacteraceae bacterium]|nr:hypothetical protein [Steroidobacteraceae bacterium]
MPTIVDLKPEAVRYVSAKVAAGEFASPDALLNALIEERIAREADYDRWFRAKVKDGIDAAEAGDFASEAQIKALLQRWP